MHTQRLFSFVASGVMLMFALAVIVGAHEVTYQGTVLAVEVARLQVKTVDAATKKEQNVWFAVNGSTKVKRGDKTVSYAEAGMVKDERVVVIVDHDAATKMLAVEIRLAVKK